MGMLVPIIFLCLASYANGKICEYNQFWSSILERCENCSRCTNPDIVIRPCERYADTVCGPLSELNIDWTWLKNQGSNTKGNFKHGGNHQKKMLDTFKENFDQIRQHELHIKEKQRYLRRKHNKDLDDSSEEIEGGDIFVGDRYKFKKDDKGKNFIKLLSKHRSLEDKVSDHLTARNGKSRNLLDEPMMIIKTWQKLHRAHSPDEKINFKGDKKLETFKSGSLPLRRENSTYDPNHLKFDENGILIKNFGFTKIEENVKIEKLIDDIKFSDDFSTTERFILDWQTVILGIAVSSCIIFFLVAAIYSIQHARHWKKLRNYFDADVEELRSWISTKDSESKNPSSEVYKTTTEVVHTGGTHCKYLERIIRMNGKNRFNFVKSNVYEKDNKAPTELKPLRKKFPLVHQKFGDRV